MKFVRELRTTLEMIKWEHSIFALPFALSGAMLAAGGLPRMPVLGWIVVAMVAARSAAMAFNRLADRALDAANPRTRERALPSGRLSPRFVALFVVVSCLVFMLAAARLNRLAFYLSPLALAILLLYSFSKRFTRWSHLLLGFSLGISPAAAWIAVTGTLDLRILLLTVAVTFWVAGFDILYACQDLEFDRASGLFSVPQSFGVARALAVARLLHVMMLVLLGAVTMAFHLGTLAILGVVSVGLLIGFEHSLVTSTDLTRVDTAFFTLNGVISVVFFCFVAADLLFRR